MIETPHCILITGASSGIGAALAYAYADEDNLLILTGRNPERLTEVVRKCEQKGAKVKAYTVSVDDREEMTKLVQDCYGRRPIDLVVANAGISAGTDGEGKSDDQVRRIFATNVDGVFNTINPLIPLMKKRGRGQIAIMSSMASFRGLAGAPAYCASKAAVRVYGEALRAELEPAGVDVNVICPGFVVSRITAKNGFKMPFLMPAEKAARYIKMRLKQNVGRIAFPFPMYMGAWFLASLPAWIADLITTSLPKKGK